MLVVRRAAVIDAPPSKVWEIIVSPALWKHWMLAEPELAGGGRLELGSTLQWKEDGKPYLTGTVSVFETARRLVLELDDISWSRKAKPGEVTYALALSDRGGATQIEFTLGDLSIDSDGQRWHDAYAASRELEAIKELAER